MDELPVGGDTTASVASPPTPTPEPAAPSHAPAVAGEGIPSPTPNATEPELPAETSAWYGRFTKLNERTKQAEARVRALEDTYGEMLSLPPDQGRALAGLLREMNTNPVGATAQLVSRLLQHPQLGPQMAAAAAQWARTSAPQGQPAPATLDPDLVAENGEGVYSAKRLQQILNQQAQALEARFASRLNPLEQTIQQARQQAQYMALERHADAAASQQLEIARTWHGFSDHEQEIAQLMAEHPPNPAMRDPGWSLQDAYLYVLHTKILPTLPAQAQAQVVANFKQKAAAATLSPASGPANGPPRFDDSVEGFKKALEHFSR